MDVEKIKELKESAMGVCDCERNGNRTSECLFRVTEMSSTQHPITSIVYDGPHKYDLDLIHVGICHTLSNMQPLSVA